jgi:predicted DNA-binding ribbon-helix-helix protein
MPSETGIETTMCDCPIGGNQNRLKEAAGDLMSRQSTQFIVTSGGKKKLRGFNICVGERRTSVRLSPVVAKAVGKIAARERCELDELYSYIDRKKEKGVSRATAIRDFVVRYFMDATTAAGHRKAGHGKLIGKRRRKP